jgi:hypothetical protein
VSDCHCAIGKELPRTMLTDKEFTDGLFKFAVCSAGCFIVKA